VDSRISEDTIREDLDHIHNLVVIRVEFHKSSCYISTNSVHNAMFARTCMMSRALYKGSKIDWNADECNQPYSQLPKSPAKRLTVVKKVSNSATNRFQLLNLDDEEEEGEDEEVDYSDEDEITSAFHASKNRVGIAA
jgi:hypothetical protein